MKITQNLPKRYIWIICGIFFIVIVSLGQALILPQRDKIYDFVVLYAANLGIIHHIPLYNTPALTSLMISQLHLSSNFTLYPYPYPPWYPLSTFFLGFLSPHQAANAWTLLNVAMLLISAILITENWKPFPRILMGMGAVLFIPSLGLMVVGQYSAPILLGATLFIYAVKREDAPLTALGLLLLTFKPHLGLFLLPVSFFWLLRQNTPFSRRAIWLTLDGGLILAALGFIADPAWPVSYIRALIDYTKVNGISDLGLSAGFSAMLIKLIFGQGNAIWSTWLSVGIVALLLTVFWRLKIFTHLETLVAGCVLLTLLGDPYLLNYDYILLLLPLIYLIEKSQNIIKRIVLIFIYFVPWASLLLERNANILYAISAIFLLGVVLQKRPNFSKND